MGYSLQQQRVIFSNDGVLSDLSVTLNDFRATTATIAYTTAEDYLVIGSDLPFNHRWIEVSTANDLAATVSVDIWFANAWHAAVDVQDETVVSGVSLAQSGFITWSSDFVKGWDFEQRSSDIPLIATTDIYDMYWCRLKWSATLKATTALKYVGHKFSSDSDMYSVYPDLNSTNLKTMFASGKTTWADQCFMAAETILRDLKRQGVILSASQLMDPGLLKEASIHKTAELIYMGMGTKYIDIKREAASAYKAALDIRYFKIDRNADGKAEQTERFDGTGNLLRR